MNRIGETARLPVMQALAPLRGANTRVARLRQAARQARTALRREPVVRPDFLPRQSGGTRPLPGQKVRSTRVLYEN